MSTETEKADQIDKAVHKDIKQRRSGFRKFIGDMLNMHDGMMSYEEIDEMMLENTVIHGPNMWILCLAALIASIGLNMNSTAVIIGAMLISPLMSGIMTMGYSLAVRDLRLLRRALIRFGTQVVISLISSTVYFLITPLDTPTAEMIARTSPPSGTYSSPSSAESPVPSATPVRKRATLSPAWRSQPRLCRRSAPPATE